MAMIAISGNDDFVFNLRISMEICGFCKSIYWIPRGKIHKSVDARKIPWVRSQDVTRKSIA